MALLLSFHNNTKSEIFKSSEKKSLYDIAYLFYSILLWDFVLLSLYRHSKEYQEQDFYSNQISWQKSIIKKEKLKGNIIGENIWSKNSKEIS